MRRKSLWFLYTIVKVFVDLLLSVGAFFLAYHIRFYNKAFTSVIPPIKGIPEIGIYYEFLPFYSLVIIITYFYRGYYKREVLGSLDELVKVLTGAFTSGILLFAVSFFYRTYEYSRLFIILVSLLNFVLIYVWHEVIKNIYLKYIKYFFGKPKIGVISNEEKIGFIRKRILKNKSIRVYFLPSVKDGEEVKNFVITKDITELIVDYNFFSSKIFQEILPEIDSLNIEIKIFVDVPVRLSDTVIDSTLNLPVITLKPISLSTTNFIIKRSMDIVISILVLSVLFVPLLIISLLIKITSKGPIIYQQDRVGFKGKKFKCYKFRTMVRDAHREWWKLLRYSERGEKVFKLKNDPRITSVGRVLRKYSIDEIPQFFNVLKGDMSIVGPRPQIVEEVTFYDSEAKKRLMIMPGLTGLWQVSGRADIGFEDMLKLDLFYLENWSIGLDLKIILKTFVAIFSKKGAY